MKARLAFFAYRNVLPETAKCLIRDARRWPDLNIIWAGNDADIGRTRSMIATDFVENGTEPVLVMIDHDVDWQPDDLARIVEKAQEVKGIVAGVYAKRQFHARLPFETMKDESYEIPSDRLLDCRYVSAGFMAIAREAIWEGMWLDHGFHPYFLPIIIRNEWLSEDWSFCHRVRQMGHSVYADLLPVLGHTGDYTFRPIDAVSLPPIQEPILITERRDLRHS
jgi:hypothetical protein